MVVHYHETIFIILSSPFPNFTKQKFISLFTGKHLIFIWHLVLILSWVLLSYFAINEVAAYRTSNVHTPHNTVPNRLTEINTGKYFFICQRVAILCPILLILFDCYLSLSCSIGCWNEFPHLCFAVVDVTSFRMSNAHSSTSHFAEVWPSLTKFDNIINTPKTKYSAIFR